MRRMLSACVVGVILTIVLAGCGGGNSFANRNIKITDLGVLTHDGKGNDYCRAMSINNAGQVVGTSSISTKRLHPFLWQDGSTTYMFSGDLCCDAYDINDSGVMIATSGESETVLHSHAKTWQDGIETLISGPDTQAGACAINNNGTIAGAYSVPYETNHACIWKDGILIDLGTGAGWLNAASDVNDQEQVVGTTYIKELDRWHGFIWENGHATDLGTLDGPTGGSQARAINNKGQVVGESGLNVFLWQKGTGIRSLGNLDGSEMRPEDINELGQVVGYTDSYRPFLWQKGRGMVDLNDLLPSNSGWKLQKAHSINDHGQIVGEGFLNDEYHAFMMTVN